MGSGHIPIRAIKGCRGKKGCVCQCVGEASELASKAQVICGMCGRHMVVGK